jgi:hypothetical protein
VNGDLYYQSLEPDVRSLVNASRFFQTAGNISISSQEQRILEFNDRSLLHAASGAYFDNRLLQTAIPVRLPQGIVHRAILPLDFVPLSTFISQQPAIWEGHLEGLQVLQLFTGDFGGLERCFAVTVSEIDGSIQLWEFTTFQRSDFNQIRTAANPNGESRVTWMIEFPAYTWGNELILKKLVAAEIWIDKLFGDVEFTLDWREDSNPCWHRWHRWQKCTSRSDSEDAGILLTYPQLNRESYVATMVIPLPAELCSQVMGRPANIGYQFQPRLTIKGWCRVRAMRLHAEQFSQPLYHQGLVC